MSETEKNVEEEVVAKTAEEVVNETEVEETEIIDDGVSENVEDDLEELLEGEVIDDELVAMAEALVKAEAAAKESTDRYQRTMAEFDNFRKRTIKEKANMYDNGAKEILEKLLPVVDNFERAINHISDEEKDLAITKGVEMIYKQLMDTLGDAGVKEIEALHQEFNPDLHHAVSHEENEDYDDNLVAEVFQKGYTYKESVLRHSMVKVVN